MPRTNQCLGTMGTIGTIFCITLLLLATLINIYHPYITTHPASDAIKIMKQSDHNKIVQQVRAEFADIAEQSLITHNHNRNDNVSNNKGSNREKIGEDGKFKKEGFDTASVQTITESHELRLFYRPDCTYSNAFMPTWLELSKSLPSNVTPREINCGILDSNGVSTCANWLEYGGGITSVPAMQLISNIGGIKRTLNYSGSRSYQQVKLWLSEKGITLKYNPNAEHFNDSNPLSYTYGTKEGFSDDSLFESGTAHGDHGKMADDYDAAFLTEAQEDTYGHIRDVDEDGLYKATFSKCQPSQNSPEGYQVFTRRGQWGCVVPDPNSGIKTPFDAAFATVDSYLSMLPPITDPQTGKTTGAIRDDLQRTTMKRNMAHKYSKDIRSFGLCDETLLKQKFNAYELVKSGRAILPDGVTLKDYLDAQDSASAIYNACTI